MPTNKKLKSKKVRDDGAKKKAVAPATPTEPLPLHDPYSKGLSPPQLTSLVYLSIGLTYLLEYGRTVAGGAEGSAATCAKYLIPGVVCTDTDVAVFVTMKYHSASLLAALTAATVATCWSGPPAELMRLNFLLFLSPLGLTLSTLVNGLFLSEEIGGATDDGPSSPLLYGRAVHMLGMTLLLLVIGLTSMRSTGVAPIRRPLNLVTPQSVALVTLASTTLWTPLVVFLNDGVETLLDVDVATVTDQGRLLLHFVAVDRVALTLLVLFPMLFLDEAKKKKLMVCQSLVTAYYVTTLFPKEEEYLVNPDMSKFVLTMSGIAVLVTSFLPTIGIKVD